MDDEYIPVETFTCSYPDCGVTASVAESIYVQEYGQICRRCDEAHLRAAPGVLGDRAAVLGPAACSASAELGRSRPTSGA